MSNRTDAGTTITVEERDGNQLVMLAAPDAPEDMRITEAGRIIGGGFQPAMFFPAALSPSALRIIAYLIENGDES